MSRPSRRDWLLAAAAGVAVAGICWAALPSAAQSQGSAEPATPRATAAPVAVAASAPAGDSVVPLPPLPHIVPTSIEIPGIGVRSSLALLRLNSHGALTPPKDPEQAGWFSGGPVPGDRGPAVIAGHLDSFTGPAVFLRLGQLRPGNLIVVHRSDGTSVDFRVLTTRTYPKNAFPSSAVYGPVPVAALRLITCGGAYDHARRRYPDDVVVFAQVAQP